jgi:hypothetical protein
MTNCSDYVPYSAADTADRALVYYAVHIMQSLSDDPENATLRDKPEAAREFLIGLLADLRTLCDFVELDWAECLRKGEHSYRDYLRDLPPLPEGVDDE